MSEQGTGRGAVPENPNAGHDAGATKADQSATRPAQGATEEGATESNVAGQGADQLTDADRERLKRTEERLKAGK